MRRTALLEPALACQHEVVLRFFDRVVRVSCDSDEIARALGLVYERQRVHGAGNGRGGLRVWIEAYGRDGPRVRVGRRTVRATSVEGLLRRAHLVLVNVAAAGAAGRQVLHAGAVAWDGRAVLLVGPSGSGKTTTTLALVRRGWRLLSDDFGVLDGDGLVHPFPRRLNLTEDGLALLGLRPPRGALSLGGGAGVAKWMVDIEALAPGRLAGPRPLGLVFVLGPRAVGPAEEAAGREPERTTSLGSRWWIEVDRLPKGVERRVGDIPGVEGVRRRTEGDALVLEVAVAAGARIVPALDGAMAELGVAVLSARGPAGHRPGPARRPGLERLSLPEAVGAVLPHDLGLCGRRFLYGTSGADVAWAWRRLWGRLGRAEGLYRLWPGALEDTVEAIGSAAAGAGRG